MKWSAISRILVLAVLIGACNEVQPPPVNDPFFAGQEPYGANPPSDAKIVTPEEFKNAAQQEGFTWDSLKLRQERIEATKAQFVKDEAEVKTLVGQKPAFQKILKAPPSDGSVEVLEDGNYLVTIEGRDGTSQVVTEGPRNYYHDLLESKKRFTDVSNQLRVYGYSYNGLPEALKTGLATPESLNGATLETLLNARRELAKKLEANLDTVEDAKALVSTISPRSVNPDAKPANYPADPSLEEGFGGGGDRKQKCADTVPDEVGLYKNFWWKQKFYATSVKAQGRRGTCPAFGLTAALETRIAIEKGRWVNLSEQRLWYQIAGIWEPRWYGDGANLVNRAEDFHEQGFQLPFEKTWNYNPAYSRVKNAENETYSKSCEDYDEYCSNSSAQAGYICFGQFCGYVPAAATGERFKESKPNVLFDFWDDAFGIPVSEMRLMLKQGHPMVVSFVVGAGFKYQSHGYVNSLTDPIEDKEGNVGRHITQVMGFISNADIQAHPTLASSIKQKSNQSGGGYFIIKNSWGQCKGDNGYYYVSVNWAKEFFTSVVVFDVKPSEQFKKVPNISPTLSITAPNTGLEFPFQQKITLKANAVDPDSSTTPTVTWSSDLDGLLGTGTELEVSFNMPGTRKIMAVAADGNGGYSDGVSISITGVNKPPVATIQLPLASTVIYKGVATVLQGKASDNDTGNGFPSDLPCSSLAWKSNVDGALGTGCDLEATFNTLGLRTLTLTATDANGAHDTTTVVINVKAVPLQGPPIVKILKPTKDLIVENAASNLLVTASTIDPDGSNVTRKWLIRYSTGFQVIEKVITLKLDRLGREYFIPNNYISSTSALAAELELIATDAQGEIGSDKVSIWVFYPPQ
jgi:C1A family cysteine protease